MNLSLGTAFHTLRANVGLKAEGVSSMEERKLGSASREGRIVRKGDSRIARIKPPRFRFPPLQRGIKGGHNYSLFNLHFSIFNAGVSCGLADGSTQADG